MIQLEREPGFTLVTPQETSTSLGCVAETRDPTGTLTAIMGEKIDDRGRVVRHTSGTYQWDGRLWLDHDEARTYDAHDRITEVNDLFGTWSFVYEDLELRVTGYGAKQLFHLDDIGRVSERLLYDTTTTNTVDYRLAWLDDVRPLTFDTTDSSRSWKWDDDGFLSESSTLSADKSCTRRFLWSKTDYAIIVATRDALDRTRFSGTYSFDAAGRMIRSMSIVGATRTEVAWTYVDGWSVQASANGATVRASAACNYPPSRNDFARAHAGATWSPPSEKRPTHLHALAGPLALPDASCDPSE